jgi:hypothetical protein
MTMDKEKNEGLIILKFENEILTRFSPLAMAPSTKSAIEINPSNYRTPVAMKVKV